MITLEHDLHTRLTEMAAVIRVEPDLERIVGHTGLARVVNRSTRTSSQTGWRVVALGLAAAALIVAGLVVRPDGRDRQTGTVVPTADAYFPVVSELPDGLPGPLAAGFGVPSNPPGFSLAQALIGQREGDTITEFISIGVATQDVDFAGVVGEVTRNAGQPISSIQFLESPRLLVSVYGNVGLETLSSILNAVAPTATDHPLAFSLPPMPEGYELIAQAPAYVFSTLPTPELSEYESSAGALSVSVHFSPMPPQPENIATQVQINGADGWLWQDGSDRQVHRLAWAAVPGFNVYVSGELTADEAMAIATSVRFVGEAEWRTHYQMHDAPVGPTTTGA